VGVFAFPNPGRGSTTVQLHFAGASGDGSAHGEASIYDLAGRRVRVIHRGPVARGLTTVAWDGRDDRGEELRGGVYLLRFTAGGREASARIVRR
jgi:flagellar hook assembly protein FlgD